MSILFSSEEECLVTLITKIQPDISTVSLSY